MFTVVPYLPRRTNEKQTGTPGAPVTIHQPSEARLLFSFHFPSSCVAVPCFLSVAAKPLYLSHFGTERFAPIW
jgi:hypothetical protein